MKTQLNRKMYMFTTMLVVLISLNGFARDSHTPTITKTFDMSQPGTLSALSSGGGISVRTHDEEKVIVQVFVRKNGRILSPSDPQVDDVLEDFDLDIEKNGSAIIANVKRKSRFGFRNNVGISLKIITPQEMSCDVSSSGGGVDISGVAGTHNFASSGGGVRLENVTGTTKASSSGGGVKVANQNGDARLSSSGGGVTLDGGKGNIYARSSGGGVHLSNVHGDVDASSSGGGVTVSGEAGYVKAKSSGGSVRANIRNLSKELVLESSGGGVNAVLLGGEDLGLNLDLSSDRVNIDLHNFSGKSEKDRVKGTMNNGGIPVYIRSSGGNINVRFND